MGIVYLATNTLDGGKGYVGKTVKTLAKRRKEHECALGRRKGGYFRNAIYKYGKEAFVWEVVYESNDENELFEAEKVFIEQLGTKYPNGYNLTEGGQGTYDYRHSEETRRKISESSRGKPQSEESNLKRSQTMRGKTKPPGFGEKLRKARTGTHQTEESKRRNRESNLGKHSGADNGMYGRRQSEESNRKNRESNLRRYEGIPTNRALRELQRKIDALEASIKGDNDE